MEKDIKRLEKIIDKKKNEIEKKELLKNIGEKVESVSEAVRKIPVPKDKVSVKNFPKEVKVNNLQELKIPTPPKEVSIKNLDEIPKPYKEVEVKKPSWFSIKGIKERLDLLIKQNSDKEIDLDRYTERKNPLSVRLVKNDLSSFYESVSRGGGGGNYATPKFGPKALSEVDSRGIASDHYDEVTRAVKTIDYAHHEIHEGNHYYVQTTDADLDNGQSLVLRLNTPNTVRWDHFTPFVSSSLGGVLYLYENPTLTTPGTALVEHNRDRNSPNTATLQAFVKPAITANGTLLQTVHIGTYGKKGDDGAVREQNEWILRQNEDYLLIFTSHADDNEVALGADWYEHINLSNG